jgi:hypothetical protein
MAQDQYGQARGPGYVVHDDAVPDDENQEFTDGQSKPMTRLQKVASALRGGTERDEQDQADGDEFAADRVAADQSARDHILTDRAAGDQAATANSPISRSSHPEGDYWDEPAASAADQDEAVAVTSPGVPVSETDADPLTRQDQGPGQAGPDATDHPPTQPDMFGTTTRGGNGATSASYPEDQADDATIPGVPAGEATGTAGRHAATASGGTESRPDEAAGMLGDFSDLTYGNLIPDAAQYTNQWHQVQFKFVDDPRASVTEAADIITQVTARLEAAIQERQRAIEERQRAIAEQQSSLRGRWGEGTNADTEGLRETLRMYRTFLDQLIGPRAG